MTNLTFKTQTLRTVTFECCGCTMDAGHSDLVDGKPSDPPTYTCPFGCADVTPAQPATLAALEASLEVAAVKEIVSRFKEGKFKWGAELVIEELETRLAKPLEAALSLAGLPRCSVALMECENWIDEPTMECITHGGKFPAAQATGGEADD